MKKALVLFTGINFSHDMAEKAVTWAARNNTSVQALFLRARKEKEESYGYPSDLDLAEKLKDSSDAERDDMQLIGDYQEILQDIGGENKVQVTSEVLTDPGFEEILSYTKDASIVFVDASYHPDDPLSPKHFSIEKLRKHSVAPIEIVSETK